MGYIADLAAATRTADPIGMGVSPRGTLALLNAVRAYAMVCGREFVTPEDIKALAVPVLAHRLILQRGGSRNTGAAVMADILDQVPVPTEDWSR